MSSAERIASGATFARQRLGSRLLDTFEATDGQLHALLAGLTPSDRQRPCYHGGSIVPAANFIDLRLNELTVHDWDIRSSLEPGPAQHRGITLDNADVLPIAGGRFGPLGLLAGAASG
jgi:hypothetical protein